MNEEGLRSGFVVHLIHHVVQNLGKERDCSQSNRKVEAYNNNNRGFVLTKTDAVWRDTVGTKKWVGWNRFQMGK